MGLHEAVLVLATLLCALVAGFVLAFAVVVMPGISSLEDREFIRAFQVVDGVIQRNQPIFLFVWVGSALALAIAVALSLRQLEGVELAILVVAALVYFLGVQLPTVTINVPLNNELQALDVAAMDEGTLGSARKAFESRWNRWNSVRTGLASLTAVMLMGLLLRL